MKKNKKTLFFTIFTILFVNFQTFVFSEIMHLTGCKNLKDGFIKNEYILDFEKSLMKRNYIYDSKTFKKYRTTDLSVKQENIVERFIYEDESLILTDKIGYPQFYTQLVFERNKPLIKIKTVINGDEGISKISTCDKVEVFVKES
ncbi:hypothetical protein [Candidatus Pelagibacter sp. Uisw_137]|jgi:hypothetical protein|uniref:hypothetical protein n=1 Tax=Candidatus Pelagibacter sp. Uisw_137 TaxID=3230992 RepID=UPI00230AF898|nr:hypothetical protein [Candidatus Pelagibacter sp.]MDB2311619.1 hypothetical protein [Candidatus Pelagibacter bacterium]